MANEIVGQVGVRIVPDGSQFGPDLQALLNRATAQAAQGGQAIGKALSSAGVGAEELGRSIENNVGGKFANAAIQAAGFTAAVYASKAAIEKTVGKLSGLFDQLAQAQAGFSSILKSEQAGGRLLDEIREFARVSPFVTQELVNYSQQLLGVGQSAESIVPLLEDVGNIVSSVGGDTQNIGRVLFTLTQIRSIGRLAGQDAMQLQSALIPITKYLSEYLGKTTAEVKKLQEQGSISADTVFAAIQAQGDKVEGAMANATRNISGARSVLQDTITIMLQNQPVLNMIFEDIYKSIVKFADFLGTPEFQDAFQTFFQGVEKVYEGLKPLVSSLTEIGGTGILTTLKTFAGLLDALGTVVNGIPESAMKVLAQVLASIALLKAPTMLFQYVNNLRTMASIFSVKGAGGLIGGLTGTAGAMAQVNAQAEQGAGKLQRWMTRLSGARSGGAIGGIATIGAATAGSLLSGNSNPYLSALGGAAQYGALGFAVGGVPGAVVGAGVGALTSYIGQAEAKATEHVNEMKRLGAEAADSFIEAGGDLYRSATGESSSGFGAELARLRAEQARITAEAEAARGRVNTGSGNTFDDVIEMLPSIGAWGDNYTVARANDAAAAFNGELARIEQQAEDTRKAMDALFEPIAIKVREIVPLLQDTQAAFQLFTDPNDMGGRYGRTGSSGRVDTDNWVKLEAGLKQYGLTLNDIATKAPDQILAIINSFDGLTTAQQEATLAATEFLKKYTDAAAAAAGIYQPQQDVIGKRLAGDATRASAIEAQTAALAKQGDVTAKLRAEQALLAAMESAYTDALARGLTAVQAQAAAERARSQIMMEASTARAQQVQIENATNAARIEQLLKLSEVADNLENRNIAIDVTVQGIEAALAKLASLDAMIRGLASTPGAGGDDRRNLGLAKAKAQRELDLLTGKIQPTTAADKAFMASLTGGISTAVAAANASSASAGGPTGPTFEDLVKNAGDSLASAIEGAMEAVEQAADAWKGTIKERTQYEAAVSAGRALKNTGRQISDLQFIQNGIATLKGRGLSEAAIEALDINSITDARQIRKLLRADSGQLTALSSAVANRDQLASTIASERQREETRKTIIEAILAAAAILGYEISPEQARTIEATFNINGSTDPNSLTQDILSMLSGGRITR